MDFTTASAILSSLFSLASVLIAVGVMKARHEDSLAAQADLEKRLTATEKEVAACREHNLRTVQNYVTSDQFNRAVTDLRMDLRELRTSIRTGDHV